MRTSPNLIHVHDAESGVELCHTFNPELVPVLCMELGLDVKTEPEWKRRLQRLARKFPVKRPEMPQLRPVSEVLKEARSDGYTHGEHLMFATKNFRSETY